ncbi:PhoH family protein [Haliovirga abyssi]|uniref:PIN domain-containing protein n=1 Tax=Haliovirga abyssi TaxID=2996794 RepID=A0AAU9DL86_9FUSO|nr:PhoH family protein [Haliovirga abyssi]BDU50697.1 hypothetical protein HLVA_12660 [Haliovirga abyssi]
MIKVYILDTNVLIHDPEAIFSFEDNEVILPIYVIEEIDKLKKEQTEVGSAARRTARNIDKLREKGTLSNWIKLDNGGYFKVETKGNFKNLPDALQNEVMDNRILSVAYEISNENSEKEIIFVTKDINMRIKADSLGLEVQDYETNKIRIEEFYTGNLDIEVEDEKVNEFYNNGYLKRKEIGEINLYPNQTVTVISKKSHKKQGLTVYKKNKDRLKKMTFGKASIWGVDGRNKEQKYAIELLMDMDIKVVTLIGKAGTGKTLLALATGLEQVVERHLYKKLFIARPIMPMGKDLGYLPGGEKEKLKPWMQPIYDNLAFLSANKEGKEAEKLADSLEAMGLLKIEALTYIRGRSIPAGFIIIDEAQNLTPHEIKTVITRAGEDTKVIFTGDPYQIDNPYLDANSNGLTYLAERLKGEEISGHVTLLKGERSELAEIAAKLL